MMEPWEAEGISQEEWSNRFTASKKAMDEIVKKIDSLQAKLKEMPWYCYIIPITPAITLHEIKTLCADARKINANLLG